MLAVFQQNMDLTNCYLIDLISIIKTYSVSLLAFRLVLQFSLPFAQPAPAHVNTDVGCQATPSVWLDFVIISNMMPLIFAARRSRSFWDGICHRIRVKTCKRWTICVSGGAERKEPMGKPPITTETRRGQKISANQLEVVENVNRTHFRIHGLVVK